MEGWYKVLSKVNEDGARFVGKQPEEGGAELTQSAGISQTRMAAGEHCQKREEAQYRAPSQAH